MSNKNIVMLLVTSLFMSLMSRGNIPRERPTFIQTWNAQRLNQEITQGKLIYQTVDLETGRFGAYFYKKPNGDWISLTNSISGINILLKEEFSEQKSAKEYLNQDMIELLVACLATTESKLINDRLLRFADSEARPSFEQYFIPEILDITDSYWNIKVNVVTDLGGVENWQVSGRLDPFQVESFSRKIVEPAGTMELPLEIGG